jgi:alkanesulfonate monooxygenase SsuD/methylene tetrahydromethanopterin reductase-like flavin-dependent oxidoreductase (luciferase family)
VSAAILPLHDPIRIAEQISVLDNAAPGRLWVVVGAGYRVAEFEMAGIDHARRGKILEEFVETLKTAWTGEPFEYQGRTVVVTPKPASVPHPMVLVGGGVPAAARRAARLKLPMLPMNTDLVVRDAYKEESEKVGYRGFLVETQGPTFVHVSDDPEKAWAEIGPYVLYDSQTYASYQTPGQHSTPGVKAESVDDLKASSQFVVGTPEQVRARLEQVPPDGSITLSPLAGGLPPDVAWRSLELFATQVLPHLQSPGRG